MQTTHFRVCFKENQPLLFEASHLNQHESRKHVLLHKIQIWRQIFEPMLTTCFNEKNEFQLFTNNSHNPVQVVVMKKQYKTYFH